MINISKFLIAAALLLLVATTALLGGPANGLEVSLMRELAMIRADWPRLTGIVAGLTTIGGAQATLGAASGASLWLLFRRSPARTFLLALTVVLERLMVEGLKEWIGRPRPDFGLDWLPHSLAFPSGHSANSMTAFLAIALIAAPPRLRCPAAIAAVALSTLIGLTRIYLGVHWPSDVIGGWALGLLTVGAAMAIGRQSGALHFEPQHEVVGRHRSPLEKDESA